LPGFLRLYREPVVRAWQEQEGTIREERAAAQKRFEDVSTKIDWLTRRALLDDDFDPEAVRRAREGLEREKAVVEVEVADLSCDAPGSRPCSPALNMY
jgi:hypothetical protein